MGRRDRPAGLTNLYQRTRDADFQLHRSGGLDASGIQAALDRRMEVKREIWALQRQLDSQ